MRKVAGSGYRVLIFAWRLNGNHAYFAVNTPTSNGPPLKRAPASLYFQPRFSSRVFTSTALTSFAYFAPQPPGAFHIIPARGIKKHQAVPGFFLLSFRAAERPVFHPGRAKDEDEDEVAGVSSSGLLPWNDTVFEARDDGATPFLPDALHRIISPSPSVPFYPPPRSPHLRPAPARGWAATTDAVLLFSSSSRRWNEAKPFRATAPAWLPAF